MADVEERVVRITVQAGNFIAWCCLFACGSDMMRSAANCRDSGWIQVILLRADANAYADTYSDYSKRCKELGIVSMAKK